MTNTKTMFLLTMLLATFASFAEAEEITLPKLPGYFYAVDKTIAEESGLWVAMGEGRHLRADTHHGYTAEIAEDELLMYSTSRSETDDTLKTLGECKRLNGFMCNGSISKITMVGMKALGKNKNLKYLEPSKLVDIDSNRFNSLATMKYVEVLDLRNAIGFKEYLTAKQLKNLKKMKKLRVIKIHYCSVANNAAASALCSIKSLRSVTVSCNTTAPTLVAKLASMKQLLGLTLTGSEKGDVSQLASCSSLESLTLIGPDAEPEEFSELANCENLVRLKVENWHPFAESFLSNFSALTNLKALSLTGCWAKSLDYLNLSKLVSIEQLDLSNTKVDDVALSALFLAMKKLVSIDLAKCEKIEGQCFLSMPKLVSLNVSGVSIDDSSILMISRCPTIEHLYLNTCKKLTTACYKHLTGLKSLKTLHIEGQKINDEVLLKITKCKNLETLSIENCKGYTDIGLKSLLQLKKLQRLKGTYTNKSLSKGTRAELEKHCKANIQK